MSGHPPSRPNRRSPRKSGFDYKRLGAYFVTICTHQRRHLFCEIQEDAVLLNATGLVVDHYWRRLPIHFAHVKLDHWVIMPNHLHAVVWLQYDVDADTESSDNVLTQSQNSSLSAVIGTFKSLVSRRVHRMAGSEGRTIWQERYCDSFIRSERALYEVRRYIVENPRKWSMDRYNHASTGIDPSARALWDLLKNDASKDP